MTAPDMESVIAAAIKAHPGATTKPGTNEWHCNGCGDMIHSGRMSRASENLDAHQARAVLAAISEAGSVEWAVTVESRPHDVGEASSDPADRDEMLAQIAMWNDKYGANAYLVTRIAGPWTAVEG